MRPGKRARGLLRILVIVSAMVVAPAVAARAADFVAVCEANQAYDTGKPTTEDDHRICRCIRGRLDAKGESVAIEVFQKVLAARRAGLGLHPSQIDLDELVALMSFSDSLQACGQQVKAGKAAF